MDECQERNKQKHNGPENAVDDKGASVEPIQKAPGMTVRFCEVDPIKNNKRHVLGSTVNERERQADHE
jgi:hypothetical protein